MCEVSSSVRHTSCPMDGKGNLFIEDIHVPGSVCSDSAEKKGVTDISLFVAIIYSRYWNEAPVAERAPLNDARLLAQIQVYPHRAIGNAARKAFRCHLWYSSEYQVGLAFFDDRVNAAVKKEMVQNLQHLPKPKALKRLEGGRFNHQSPLDTLVTQRTAELFDVLVKDGQERATSFLVKELPDWSRDLTYLRCRRKPTRRRW